MINIKRYKWVIIAEGDKILSNNGFKYLNKSQTCVPRLFNSKSLAKKYMKRYQYINYQDLEYIPVNVTIEEEIPFESK